MDSILPRQAIIKRRRCGTQRMARTFISMEVIQISSILSHGRRMGSISLQVVTIRQCRYGVRWMVRRSLPIRATRMECVRLTGRRVENSLPLALSMRRCRSGEGLRLEGEERWLNEESYPTGREASEGHDDGDVF